MTNKISLLALTCFFFAFAASGQITTRQLADKLEAPIPVYDSLENLITL
jgi:hypothetical protein